MDTTENANSITQVINLKFARKPAKMGEDYIFWIPRVYVKNGLVDPTAEYVVYLVKVPKK